MNKLASVKTYFWGTVAIWLGGWEAIAFIFGRPYTITKTLHQLHRRYGWKSRFPVIAALCALGRHLLFAKKEV